MATKGKPTVDGVAQPDRGDAKSSQSSPIRRAFLGLLIGCVVLFFVAWTLLWRDELPATLTEGQPPAGSGQRQPLPSGVPGKPTVHGYRVVRRYHHDPESFTQGLFWLNGSLYESKGLYGHSGVREVNLEDGSVVREVRNDDSDFGEGIVNVGNGEILEILWRTGRGKRYSARAGSGGHLQLAPPHFHTGLSDGWGLEVKDQGETLIVTISGPEIYFLDRHTMKRKGMVTVKDAGVKVEMINELEMIEGELWANIFGKDCIARLHPDTGEVLGWVLFDTLLDRRQADAMAREKGIQRTDVFNGIAWDPDRRRLFVTGKLWPYLYEVELVEQTSDEALEHARKLCIPDRNIFR